MCFDIHRYQPVTVVKSDRELAMYLNRPRWF